MHISTAAITATSKGHRIWIQALESKGITAPWVQVTMAPDTITLTFSPHKGEGKWRKVTQSKGGVVDLTSKKVTVWARGHDRALVTVTDKTITITRD